MVMMGSLTKYKKFERLWDANLLGSIGKDWTDVAQVGFRKEWINNTAISDTRSTSWLDINLE